MQIRLPVRLQLALPFLLLVCLPGLQHLDNLDRLESLEDSRREQLESAARMLVKQLALQPGLFAAHAVSLPNKPAPPVIPLLERSMTMDGRDDEWFDISPLAPPGVSRPLTDRPPPQLRLGANDAYLYLFLKAVDHAVVYRDRMDLSVTRNDHLRLVLVDADGVLKPYIIATREPGNVVAHVVSVTGRSLRREPEIAGIWVDTVEGYNIELRILRQLFRNQVGIDVVDVDNPQTRETASTAGGGLASAAEVPAIRLPSPRLDRFLADQGFEHVEIAETDGSVLSAYPRNSTPPEDAFRVRAALDLPGRPKASLTLWEDRASIAAAAEKFNQVLLIRTAAIAILALLVWLMLAMLFERRIKRLERRINLMVDARGGVTPLPGPTVPRDEFGDLDTHFSAAAERAAQYQQHLEQSANRLTHELRTPISVVKSSLDNIPEQTSADVQTYVQRAQSGVLRLQTLLNKLTEARRLEASLNAGDMEIFPLNALVEGCIGGYRLAWPGYSFEWEEIAGAPLRVSGVPDLVAQLLDKLIANAVSFHTPGTAIVIQLNGVGNHAVLSVINDGPPLTEDGADPFDSMVSTRPGGGEHLGLGLYIARIITRFHHGTLNLSNHNDRGVVATLRLPLMRLSSQLLNVPEAD